MSAHSRCLLGALMLLSAGCGRETEKSQEERDVARNLAEITSETEEGFADLLFSIQDHATLQDGSQRINVAGLHKGRQLGFEIILDPTWKKGALGKDVPITTYRGGVKYRHTGPGSDLFLQVLDDLYGTKLGAKSMATETQFTGISLEGNPAALADGPVKIKLFFEKGGED